MFVFVQYYYREISRLARESRTAFALWQLQIRVQCFLVVFHVSHIIYFYLCKKKIIM